MIGVSWWRNRQARVAAKHLRRGLLLVDAASKACDSHLEGEPVSPNSLRRAENQIKLARKTIEELPELSFTTQSRFFRLFEWLEECLDYAIESIGYEEYDSAQVDLCRARKAIRDAAELLSTNTGIRPTRPPMKRNWPKPSLRLVRNAAPKHQAQVIHLLQAPETPCTPPERTRAVLL